MDATCSRLITRKENMYIVLGILLVSSKTALCPLCRHLSVQPVWGRRGQGASPGGGSPHLPRGQRGAVEEAVRGRRRGRGTASLGKGQGERDDCVRTEQCSISRRKIAFALCHPQFVFAGVLIE